ncbi:MAG: beta-lactamase family protein [Chloroflexi bacterium]|nr:beta-lactamase family protein [Chloroflexota bacterium]
MTVLARALRTADGIADAFLVGKHIPGIVYGVVAGGELVHSRGVGTLRVGEQAVPDADSVFRIASMTKSFTAATVISLRDEGRLSLDDPIGRHVPELASFHGPTADSPAITVRHLLTMTSGLATDDPWGDRQQGLDLAAFSALLRGPLTFAWTPGTRFEYSNLGYGILGRLVTNIAGAEYREVVRERILRPLGMDSTTYLQAEVPEGRLAHGYLWRDEAFIEEPLDPYGALASMGGIFTSVRDLSRWVAFFTDAFPPRDDPEGSMPLSRASRREMQQASGIGWSVLSQPKPDLEPEVEAGGYGLGLFVEEHSRWGRIVGHSGGYPGFGSNMRWQPASGLGVIVLANHRYAPSTGLARDLLASLIESDAIPARRIRPAAALSIARAEIDRLLVSWDDELAGRLFAMNVELDDPVARRRDEIARIRELHGPLRSDSAMPEQSKTPLHAVWWLADAQGGRVRVEIRLAPESPALVQTFGLASVPAPDEALAAVAVGVITAINGPRPAIPVSLVLGPDIDRVAIDRIARIVAARYAPLMLGPAVAGDGVTAATWRLRSDRGSGDDRGNRGNRGELELAVGRDPGTAIIATLALVQQPPQTPSQGD